MVSNTVSEVSEGVGRMVNRTSLTSGLLQGWEPVGGGRPIEAETHVHNELVEVGGFRKVTEEGLVRRSWVDGSEERIWKPSLRIHLRW